MYSILCYGDSNTWGFNPKDGSRYPKHLSWTGIMKKELGDNYDVIVEGLNSRTTVWDDPIEGEYKNGKKFLFTCLQSHKPIDLVIIFLGTNDLKSRFNISENDIARGVETLVKIIQKSESGVDMSMPEILVIIPTKIEGIKEAGSSFDRASEEKSKLFSIEYKEVLKDYDIHMFDASEIIEPSKIDGVHFDLDKHELLGKSIAKMIKNL